MSSGGTWASQSLFCGWLRARSYDAREKSICIPKRGEGWLGQCLLIEGNFWGVPEFHSKDMENCHIPADKNHHKIE